MQRQLGKNNGVMRFPLADSEIPQACNPNDLLEMHLRLLLDLLIPTQRGRDLKVDGYKPLNDRHAIHPLYPDGDAESSKQREPLDLYEPRLGYIRRMLESLQDIVELEADGKPIKVDAFRLKNLDHWLAPGGGAGDIIAHAGARCNLSCRFCYNKGTNPALEPRPRDPDDERREIEMRIEHYVPRGRLNLFPNMGSPSEALAHPHILDILKKLRAKTDEVFRISTNGAVLTPEMVHALARLEPIYLDLSLNSSSPERRAWLMNDSSPETAIDSPALLKDARVPFTIVIVPWPFPSCEEMLDDLRSTVAFAAESDPVMVQISLPGCARKTAEESRFPLEKVWSDIKNTVQELRSLIDCPIVTRPGIFEEYDDPDAPNEPTVVGIVKNSPAAIAGLRGGDRLSRINSLPVKSRSQARSLLTTLHQSDINGATLDIERDGQPMNLQLDLPRYDYPYTPETSTHLGAVFCSSGIPQEWLERLKDVIIAYQAKQVLVLTSRSVRSTLEKMISHNGLFAGTTLHLHVPENLFFGGNIFMGDLLVTDDFIHAAEEYMERSRTKLDLIVVPSSPFHLSGWGRDLTGRVYLDIERALGIPVALVDCEPIFD
jgi:pyruvate-formate lyase-activating enzyme